MDLMGVMLAKEDGVMAPSSLDEMKIDLSPSSVSSSPLYKCQAFGLGSVVATCCKSLSFGI